MQPTAAAKWEKPPGKLDALNTKHLYASADHWGLPMIGNQGNLRPAQLWPYHIRTRSQAVLGSAAVHFYLDDYQFESAWSSPKRTLSKVSRFAYAITPDFSVWSHWPLVLIAFNIYRARWIGAYWMAHGLTVIPNLTWAGQDTLDICLSGIKPGSTVAISTVGKRTEEAIEQHQATLETALQVIQPSNVLCYGKPLADLNGKATSYPTFWKQKEAKPRPLEA